MSHFTAWHVRYHAGRVQALAFYGSIPFALAFMGLAINGLESYAMAAAVLGALAIGISFGAWCVGARFKD